jgi:L-threonylcarbamoyladenylate synthase
MTKVMAPMTSRPVIAIDYDVPQEEALAKAVSILRTGGLVVAPTETRYGLLARADFAPALGAVYGVKGRPTSLPTAVFARSAANIWEYGRQTPIAIALAARFLPGPLTLVLEAICGLKEPVVHEGRIGLRYSPAPVIDRIVASVDFPITATSANISGSGDLETVADIAAALASGVDLFLDCGRLASMPSTVVDCSGSSPYIVREGAISGDSIREAAGLDVSE